MKLENFFIKKNNGTIESHCEEQIIASTYSLVIRNRFTLVGTIWDPSIYTCFGLGYQLPFHQGYSTIGVIESSDMQGKFSVGDKVLYSPQFSKYTCVGISELQKNNIVKINCNIDTYYLYSYRNCEYLSGKKMEKVHDYWWQHYGGRDLQCAGIMGNRS